MTAGTILLLIGIYFSALFLISYYIGRKNQDNQTFFKANSSSKWYLVAVGMIGTALSGVTFISVPGSVGKPEVQFSYFQFIMGNAVGYLAVALILLPLYYRLQLTSIYTYIEQRFGTIPYKTAASLFLLGRTIGSSFRLYLVVIVLQRYVFDAFGVPFWTTVLLSLFLIFAYTYKSGLKTIIITDTLQTLFLISSVILTLVFIGQKLDWSPVQVFEGIKKSSYSQVFFWEDFHKGHYFWKQFIGGFFVTLSMVGLDQDLMQKNLSCKNLEEAQKNMFTFTGIIVVINLFFLSVGALLYIFKDQYNIPMPEANGHPHTDYLFPEIALHHMSLIPAVTFILGLTAATFATTDSALTALTTSFCIDFLGMDKKTETNERQQIRLRHRVHIAFSLALFAVIMVFNAINDRSVISVIFQVASYTYGPLLGLFSFGLIFKTLKLKEKAVPVVCVLAPFCCWILQKTAPNWSGGYVFDNELVFINGLFTFVGLWLVRSPKV